MTTPVSFTDHGVSLRVDVPNILGPLDNQVIEGYIQAATQHVTRELARLKFAHDIRLLRAVLYTLGSTMTLADAHKAIEDNHEDEQSANGILHGYLAGQGWRPYAPVNGTRPQYRDGTGLLGARIQVKLGQEYAGDIIVDLHSGRALVAKAIDAYLFEWLEIPSKRKYVPAPHETWWLVGNYKKNAGYDPGGKDSAQAYRDLTVPAVPADLDAMLAMTAQFKED